MNETMTKAAPELGGQKASEQSVLDLLLGTAENVEEHLPTGRYEVPRLSKRAGKPVVLVIGRQQSDKSRRHAHQR